MSGYGEKSLEAARKVIERTFRNSAQVLQYSNASDGAGGWTQNFTASGTVNCTLSPNVLFSRRFGGNEGVHASELQSPTDHFVMLPRDTALKPTDRLLIDGTLLLEVIEVIPMEMTYPYAIARCSEIS